MSPKGVDYMQNAAECRRLARVLNIAEHRETLLAMAFTWERLAKERARNSERAVASKRAVTPFVSTWPQNK